GLLGLAADGHRLLELAAVFAAAGGALAGGRHRAGIAAVGIAPGNRLPDRRRRGLLAGALHGGPVGLVERGADLVAEPGAGQGAGGNADQAAGAAAESRTDDRSADAAEHGADGLLVHLRTAIPGGAAGQARSEEHTSELQSRENLVCRLLLEKKKYTNL